VDVSRPCVSVTILRLILSRKKRNIQHARLHVRERDGARDGTGFHVAFFFRDDERRFTARAP